MKSNLRQPLLNKSQVDDNTTTCSEQEASFCPSLKTIAFLGYPMVIAQIFPPLTSTITNVVLGHETNADALAGYGLGSLTISILGLTISQIFTIGTGTFSAQAYGAKDFRLCAVYLNRSIFLNSVLFFCLWVLTWFIKPIYIAIGQTHEMVEYAALYVTIVMPFVVFEFLSASLQQYAVSQHVRCNGTYANIAAFISHAFFTYLLYYAMDLGFVGLCWSQGITMVVRFLIHLYCIKFTGNFQKFEDLHFFSSETTTDLWPQIKSSLKILSQGIWEPWGVHIFTLMSSYLGANITAAQTITRNVALLFQVFAVGIQMSCLILVGNSIGKGSSRLAKAYYRISLQKPNQILFLINFSFMSILSVNFTIICLLFCIKDWVISWFTHNSEIIGVLNQSWPLMLLYLMLSGLQKPAISTLRATRIQFYALIWTFTAFWLIGIPLALYLTKSQNLGIRGLWIGQTCAAAFTCLLFHLIVQRINWERVISRAQRRQRHEEVSSDEEEDIPAPEGVASFRDDDFRLTRIQSIPYCNPVRTELVDLTSSEALSRAKNIKVESGIRSI